MAIEIEMAFEETIPGVSVWSPEAAASLAQAAWVARCARRIASFAPDVQLEQARAVAEVLADDEMLRGLLPELAAERLVRGR